MTQTLLYDVDWRFWISWGLLVSFLVASVFLALPMRIQWRRLKKAAAEIRKQTGSSGAFFSPPRAFPKESRLRPGSQQLMDLWKEFVRLQRSGTGPDRVPGRGGVHPEFVFTEARVMGGRVGGIAEALPGIFAGVGLLGTFLGISIGLEEVQISVEDPSVLMHGVQGLVGGMSTAFFTSIIGIFFSLLWLLGYKDLRHRLRTALDNFNSALLIRFPYQDPELTLQSIEDLNKEIKGSLQRLGGDITEAFEGALNRTVSPALGEVSGAMNALGERLTEQEFEGLEAIVTAFQKRMEESTEEDFRRFGQALENATNHQVQTTEKVGAFLERIEAVSSTQLRLLEETTGAAQTFSDGLGALESAQAAIELMVESLDKSMTTAATLSEQAQAHSEAYRDASESIQDLLALQLDSVKNHLDEIQAFWTRFDERLEGMTGDLSDAFTELTTFTAQKIREVFTRFDSEMASVVQHLGGTLSELRDATDELPGLAHEISTSVGAIPQVVDGTADRFKSLTDQIAASFSAIPSALDGTSEKFRAAADQINGSFSSIPPSIEKASLSIENAGQSIEKMTTGAVAASRGVSEAIEPLSSSIPAIQASAANLVEAFSKANENIAALQEELAAVREERASRGFLGLPRVQR